MNQETIEKHIKGLGKTDFDSVVALLMEKVFHQKAIDVDGKGDGGLDFRFYENEYNNKIGVQKTVVKDGWENKFIEDAKKAKKAFDTKQFYFFCTQSHEPKKYHEVEERIFNEIGVVAHIYGATEIAGFIVDEKLFFDFSRAIGLETFCGRRNAIDSREVLLHTYYALSSDRKDLQNEIYENTLLSTLFDNQTMSRKQLLEQAAELLSINLDEDMNLNARIDSLLAKGRIVKIKDKLVLSKEMTDEILLSQELYENEIKALADIAKEIISDNKGTLATENLFEFAVLIAKAFVNQQLSNIQTLSFKLSGFLSALDDPFDRIKILLKQSGINSEVIDKVILEIIEATKDNALIQKMISAVVYVCLRKIPYNSMAAILKADDWSNVKICIDSSVAIPYLSANMFGPSIERFSKASNHALKVFLDIGANLVIPKDYLNECASHLVAAIDYCVEDSFFDPFFALSSNGYVSHYFQLKQAGEHVPPSLMQYIEALSPHAFSECSNYYRIKMVMNDLENRLLDYCIRKEDYSSSESSDYKKELEKVYSILLEQGKIRNTKRPIQIEHDISVLSSVFSYAHASVVSPIFLTWDKSLITLCRATTFNNAWIVTPLEASDLIQASTHQRDISLMSLGHSLARVMTTKEEIASRMLDQIIGLYKGAFSDYEFRNKIKDIQNKAFQYLDSIGPDIDDAKFDLELNRLLKDNGIITGRDQPDQNKSSR